MLHGYARWLVPRDVLALLEIEKSLSRPWPEEAFTEYLARRNAIGTVVEVKGRVVGYMLQVLRKRYVEVIRFMVHPDFRGQGLGHRMIIRLVNNLFNHARTRIAINVSEWDTFTHQWLKGCGFRATKVVSGPEEDHYRFVYQLPVPAGTTGAEVA